MTSAAANACPCGRAGTRGRPLAYPQCCGRYLDGGEAARDAPSLMRSRYTAFVLGREAYLLATWHPGTRPAEARPEVGVKWLGLEVRDQLHVDATHAEVEFIARYRLGGRAVRLHERSRFVKEAGCWYYLDGTAP